MAFPFEKLPQLVLYKIFDLIEPSSVLPFMRTSRFLHKMVSENRDRMQKKSVMLEIRPTYVVVDGSKELKYSLSMRRKKGDPEIDLRNVIDVDERASVSGTTDYSEERENLLQYLDHVFRNVNAHTLCLNYINIFEMEVDSELLLAMTDILRSHRTTVERLLFQYCEVVESDACGLLDSIRGLRKLVVCFKELPWQLFKLPQIVRGIETIEIHTSVQYRHFPVSNLNRILGDHEILAISAPQMILDFPIRMTAECLRTIILNHFKSTESTYFQCESQFRTSTEDFQAYQVFRGLTYTQSGADWFSLKDGGNAALEVRVGSNGYTLYGVRGCKD